MADNLQVTSKVVQTPTRFRRLISENFERNISDESFRILKENLNGGLEPGLVVDLQVYDSMSFKVILRSTRLISECMRKKKI